MPELEPQPPAPVFEGRSVTRLLLRSADPGRREGLLDPAGAVVTSVSIVVPGGEDAVATVVDIGRWDPERVRLEVLVVGSDRSSGHPTEHSALRAELARNGHPWRFVARPPGGRAAALAAASAASEQEFLLLGTGGRPDYGLVGRALSLMWTEGADVALIHPGAAAPADLIDPGDPSAALSSWVGLSGPVPRGRLVLMRRWVARWLFNEITRAISPAAEVADRTRLLGIAIVEMASFEADGPCRAS